MKTPTNEEVIAELERELKKREEVYPGWVISNKISSNNAHHRLNCLRKLIADLKAMNYANPEPTHKQGDLFDYTKDPIKP